MHKYLKACGLADQSEKDIYDLLWNRVICPACLTARLNIAGDCSICEFRMELNECIGICAAVLYTGADAGQLIYYYPYYDSYEISSLNPCTLERHTLTDTYAGVIDEYSLGISLIFFISNAVEARQKYKNIQEKEFIGTYLTAFANEGIVILPVADMSDDLCSDTAALNREELLEAAMGGDEEAIETLTESEISMFQEINDRMETEDLYSVVEQSFMPFGIECDQYSIIGEITDVEESINMLTGVELWLLKISCNGISFRLCISKPGLMGEPMKGRRLKCRLWMQGRVDISQEPQQGSQDL